MQRLQHLPRILLLLTALVAGLAPLAAQADDNATFTDDAVRSCLQAGNVYVIVDTGAAPMRGGCAAQFSTGAEALRSAGFVIDNDYFVKEIDGVRADYVKDEKWWTYFHRHWSDETGFGAWEFSDEGLGTYQPKPGSIEAWTVSPASVWNGVEPRWQGYAPTPSPSPSPTTSPEPSASPSPDPSGSPEPSPSPTTSPEPSTSPSPDPSGSPSVSPSAEPSASGSPTPTASPRPTTKPTPRPAVLVAPYEVPGFHHINGRWWYTTCEPYSQTIRCRTDIWSKQVVLEAGSFVVKQGWFFNNLTYLPFMTRAAWTTNPLARTGRWTAGGRTFRTECDTAVTGANACRSYIWGTTVQATSTAPGKYSYKLAGAWVFNNIVRFRVS